MRFVDDPEIAAWLEALEGISRDFDWDAGNRTKNRKHRVDTEDVEALLGQPVLLAGRIVHPSRTSRGGFCSDEMTRGDGSRWSSRDAETSSTHQLSPDAANREARL